MVKLSGSAPCGATEAAIVIDDVDADFHETDPAEPTWAETNFFGFYQAEKCLNVGVYALFRPNLGIVGSTICMNSRRSATPWDADFCDMRASLPIPAPYDLRDYRLMNSLHVICQKPNAKWHIAYDDGEGTTIDVDYDAIMPAFDIHDPAMDPMTAAAQAAAASENFAWGTAYNGHFDQSGRFRGHVAIRGESYPIDCLSTMDHSWGPRAERGSPNMSWLHAHFAGDLAIHAIFRFDPAAGATDLELAHGYVADGQHVFGLKAGRGTTQRGPDRYADRVTLQLVDAADRAWNLSGRGLTTFPWFPWPNMVGFNVLAEWTCGTRTGFGEIQDFFELPQLNALNAHRAASAAAR
jgi:hypothetical protein